MSKVGFIILLGSFLFSLKFAYGTIGDTIIAIKEVKTTGARFDSYSTGARIYRIDTAFALLYQTANIGELLSRYSLVSVKSYGPSGLSSVSMRGGSSRHTAVIWNGFNLKSPMTGGTNYSTMPAGFIDQVTIQSGGSATMYGSGASTGAIFLTNKLYTGRKNFKVNANLELASFETYAGSIILTNTAPRLSSRLKLGMAQSENNFKYTSQTFGRPQVTLEHASFDRYAVSQQNTLVTSKRSKLETDILYTSLFKEIPSLMSDAENGTAEQEDKNFKSAVTFSYYHKRYTLKIRTGVFFDQVYYFDTVPQLIESNNKSYSTLNELESKITLTKNHVLNLGLNHSYDHASSSGYVADTGQARFSIYGRYNIFFYNKKMNISIEARKEYLKHSNIPLVFSFGGQYEFVRNTFLKTNISKHYSLPVFDDLFWAEDAFAIGNPDLEPEYGWNYEAGIKNTLVVNGLVLKNELTVFQNRIKDLIIWMPSINGKWSPANYNNSVTSGLEFSGSFNKYLKNEKQIAISYCFGYTDAKIYSGDLSDGGTQRIYVPRFKSNLSVKLLLKSLQLTYTQFFESKRYTDDVNALDPYTLSDVSAGYKLPFRQLNIKLYFKVKNMFNVEYQIYNGYAQPLRNYATGLNFAF